MTPTTVGTLVRPTRAVRPFLSGRNLAELSLLWSIHILLLTVILFPGTPIDALRPVAAFVYLLVVPGLLLARLLRVYQEDPLAQLVTAVGLSVIYDMILGLALSGIPAAVIERPLAAEVFLPTSLIITAALSLAIRTEQSLLAPFAQFARPYSLAWALLPLSAVVVALHVQGGGSNLWMVTLLAVISATPLLLLVRRPNATECAVALFSIGLALAFHKYFVSPEIPGWDSRLELFFASLVLDAGRWSPHSSHIYLAMLSVTALPVAIAEAVGLNLGMTFKILCAIILGVLPVTIFLGLRNLFSARWALIGAFLYLGNYVFTLVMLNVTRQTVATLFISLLLLTIYSDQRGSTRIRMLQLALVLGVVFSHYSMVIVIIIPLWMSILVRRLVQWREPRGLSQGAALPPLGILLTLAVFTYLWFAWASDSLLRGFVSAGERIVRAVRVELFLNDHSTSIAAGLIPQGMSYVSLLLANWVIVLMSLLGFGVCLVGALRKDHFRTYLVIIGSGGIFLGTIFLILPQIDKMFTVSRTFFMTLLWLLPLSIFGLEWAFHTLGWFRKRWQTLFGRAIAGLALLIYVALGTGLITHLVGDEDFSHALDPRITLNFHDQAALRLVSSYGRTEDRIYTDKLGQALFRTVYPSKAASLLTPKLPSDAWKGFYLYFRGANLEDEWGIPNSAPFASPEINEPKMVEFVTSLKRKMDLVFDSGGAKLYHSLGASISRAGQIKALGSEEYSSW